MTSRPNFNTLSYAVQMEITGFTDDNIPTYVQRFFDQIQENVTNLSMEYQKCLMFLKVNPRVWGIAHIPVNLELICSVWGETDWSENETLTMTMLYDKMIEWLCRRYMARHATKIQMTKNEVFAECHQELIFLETLAFQAMTENTVIIRKELLQKVMEETDSSLKTHPNLLNIGFLKALNHGPVGRHIE
ncbi:unnamed protein product, partial [Rotaria sp. Silwood1]